MKILHIVVLSALFAACSSGWSDEEKKAYLDACNRTSKGQKEYCDFTFYWFPEEKGFNRTKKQLKVVTNQLREFYKPTCNG